MTPITRVAVSVFTVPTDGPESDGTLEWTSTTNVLFYDHERIERMRFDGALAPVDGLLRPDLSRTGLGLELKRADATRYAA